MSLPTSTRITAEIMKVSAQTRYQSYAVGSINFYIRAKNYYLAYLIHEQIMGKNIDSGFASAMQRGIERLRKEGPIPTIQVGIIYLFCKISFPIFTHRPGLYWFVIKLRGLIPGQNITDADPLKLVYVNPTNINYRGGNSWPLKRGRVMSGDWDLTDKPFMQKEPPQEIQRRFEDGSVGNGGDEIDVLYSSILEDGYQSQRELLEQDPEEVHAANNEFTIPQFNEITVDIGRDGRLIWRSQGQHRLAIVKCLGLQQIPVLVCKRHSAWQRVRDVYRGAVSFKDIPDDYQQYAGHPDLQDIRNNGQS